MAELTAALVWAWPDVEKWVRKTGRLPDRPLIPGVASAEGPAGHALQIASADDLACCAAATYSAAWVVFGLVVRVVA